MATPIFEYVNVEIGEHTFHTGEPWPQEDKKDVVFYAFQEQVKGTEPVFDYWNAKDNEHTFHFGEPWPGEEKGQKPVFFAYPLGDDKKGLLQPVHSYWNTSESKHTFHMGEARMKEDKHEPMFLAFQKPLAWRPGALCDGAPASNRAEWLMKNKGMGEQEAQATVMGEFPELFGPNPPASGPYTPAPAPAAPAAPAGHFVDGKFPHTMELVIDGKGKSRVKFSVTPRNPEDVTMVAVHYSVNHEPGKEDMNFDIRTPEVGTHTYVHVTPDFGPVCEKGSKVTYWLAAMEKGLITEMPEKACPHKENRLTWIAQ